MTRILQIRRGTTAQNNNFTGMSGEMSFDTDTNTLRIHDGQKLGGYEIAKKDEINSNNGTGSDFSIESVNAEFWQELFNTYGEADNLNTISSELIPVANASHINYGFDTDKMPKFARVQLICQTPNAGYSIGDAVDAYGIGSRTNPNPNVFISNGFVSARLLVGEENFWVSDKTTGISTNIINENWALKFTLYY